MVSDGQQNLPSGIRQSLGALALIVRQTDGQDRCLVRWNAKWERFALVGGHKRDDESFRECLVREIEEELELDPTMDFSVDREPLSHLEFSAWSERAKMDTAYVHEFFHVRLNGIDALAKLGGDEHIRWTSLEEIRNLKTWDGKIVSDMCSRVFESIDWTLPE